MNSHKTHGRGNKFKTGGLVVTAVQTGTSGGTNGVKRNKKLKSLQHKLPSTGSCNLNCTEYAEPSRPPMTNHNNGNKGGLEMASIATTIARKVKTKLKKKKSTSNAKPETAINLNAIYNNYSYEPSSKSQ